MKWGATIQNAGNYGLGGDETGMKRGLKGDVVGIISLKITQTVHEISAPKKANALPIKAHIMSTILCGAWWWIEWGLRSQLLGVGFKVSMRIDAVNAPPHRQQQIAYYRSHQFPDSWNWQAPA